MSAINTAQKSVDVEVEISEITEAKTVEDAEKYQKVDSSADSIRSARVEVILED